MRYLKMSGLFLGTLLVGSAAWGGTFSVTTTQEQDRALAREASVAGRTPEQLVQGLCAQQAEALVHAIRAARTQRLIERLPALTPADKAVLDRLLQE